MKILMLISLALMVALVPGKAQDLKFNRQYAIACHNCYELKNSTDIRTALLFTKNLELDIHDNAIELGNISSKPGDWCVRHLPIGGNDNCCGGFFSDCLKRIKEWADLHPNHPVVTIFIDKKNAWDLLGQRGPEALDKLLTSIFPDSVIYSPAKLSSDCDIRAKAKADNWPTLFALNGKFIFIITGDTPDLDSYVSNRTCNAICFIAPQIRTIEEINAPVGLKPENAKYLVVYNLDYQQTNLIEPIAKLNLMSRVFGSRDENITTFQFLVRLKANFIAFDDYTVGSQ